MDIFSFLRNHQLQSSPISEDMMIVLRGEEDEGDLYHQVLLLFLILNYYLFIYFLGEQLSGHYTEEEEEEDEFFVTFQHLMLTDQSSHNSNEVYIEMKVCGISFFESKI